MMDLAGKISISADEFDEYQAPGEVLKTSKCTIFISIMKIFLQNYIKIWVRLKTLFRN